MTLIEIKTYEVIQGTTIEEAIEEAIKIAKQDKCIVQFEFDEIVMIVHPSSTKEELLNFYQKEFERRNSKIVSKFYDKTNDRMIYVYEMEVKKKRNILVK